jgi:hypothetical protein
MSINKAIKELTALKPSKTNKYRPYADQVLNLFKDRKIEKFKEAEKLLEQLASRGKAPQAAIKSLRSAVCLKHSCRYVVFDLFSTNQINFVGIPTNKGIAYKFVQDGKIKEHINWAEIASNLNTHLCVQIIILYHNQSAVRTARSKSSVKVPKRICVFSVLQQEYY